jgi:hypothetical protein
MIMAVVFSATHQTRGLGMLPKISELLLLEDHPNPDAHCIRVVLNLDPPVR